MQAALFLSTLSLRRATSTSAKRWMPTEFLSTLSLRRATGRFAKRGGKAVFLSTLSLRRATAPSANGADPLRYFYPRSPCGERPILGNPCAGCPAISIHALLAESDGCRCPPRHWHGGFLSTLSLRRATSSRKLPSSWRRFLSTLSLRRATFKPPIQTHRQKHFYPRSPCGERRLWIMLYSCPGNFYPRSPCGERLSSTIFLAEYTHISIHALLAESDRRSGRGAGHTAGISIHALLAESDHTIAPCFHLVYISIHALLAESDPFLSGKGLSFLRFLSTLSLRRATFLLMWYQCNTVVFLSTLSLRRATLRSH